MINNLAVKSFLKDLGVEENFGFFRQLAHWLLCFPTQIFYSFIVLCGFFEILIYGKETCSHRPAKIEHLVRKESVAAHLVRQLSRLTSVSSAHSRV
jgi:hypothetical protein